MTLSRKIYIGVILSSIVIIIGGLMLPGQPGDPRHLPWRFSHPSPDQLTIFGLTLGQSNANQAEQIFKEEAKPSLFKNQQDELTMEFFFEKVTLVGLRSKIVVTVDIPQQTLQQMYERGLRMSSTTSGKKISLTHEDVEQARTYPLHSLTYIPYANIEDATLIKRFGEPAEIITIEETGVDHWLYPDVALDIGVNEDQEAIFQYISPPHFDQLTAPLRQKAEAEKNASDQTSEQTNHSAP